MLTGPSSVSVRSTIRATASESATSAWIAMTRPPVSAISSLVVQQMQLGGVEIAPGDAVADERVVVPTVPQPAHDPPGVSASFRSGKLARLSPMKGSNAWFGPSRRLPSLLALRSGRQVPALIAGFEPAGTAVTLERNTEMVRPDRHPEFS